MAELLIEDAFIVTMDREGTIIPNGYVRVSGDCITEVGEGKAPAAIRAVSDRDGAGCTGSSGHVVPKMSQDREPSAAQRHEVEVLAGQGMLVIPGLINSHMHSYAGLIKGMAENTPLEVWMLHSMAAGAGMSREDVYVSALLGCIEMIRTGTTCCVDHINQDIARMESAVKAYSAAGLRAFLTPMISDKAYFESLPYQLEPVPCSVLDETAGTRHMSAEEAAALNEEAIRRWNGCFNDRIRIMVGPSGPQRCSDKLLEMCGELSERYGVGFHTHLLETKTQWVTAQQFYGTSMVRHLRDLGLVSERSSFAHSVWLTPQDIEMIAKGRATIVHNASSNLILGSGLAPIACAMDAGVNIAIGTDGPNCGANLSMFESMKLAAMLHKSLGLDETLWPSAAAVLRMATAGGARAVLASDRIGSIEKGKKADLVFLTRHTPFLAPLNDPIRQLVYGENGSSVRTVIVGGEVLMKDGKIECFDEKAILTEARARAPHLAERMEDYMRSHRHLREYAHRVCAKALGRRIGFSRFLVDRQGDDPFMTES